MSAFSIYTIHNFTRKEIEEKLSSLYAQRNFIQFAIDKYEALFDSIEHKQSPHFLQQKQKTLNSLSYFYNELDQISEEIYHAENIEDYYDNLEWLGECASLYDD